MEKSTLEKYIQKEAETRFNAEFDEMVRMLISHPILGQLEIRVPDVQNQTFPRIDLISYSHGNSIFHLTNTDRGSIGRHVDMTNLALIKQERLKLLEERVLVELLEKLQDDPPQSGALADWE